MNIIEIVESKGWKAFMAKLYGWGASVVIIGALFKIQHWPGAALMLTAGLSTEAVIFFFSAFEPLHEEIDWTLVYPELAGMSSEEDMEIEQRHSDPAKRGVAHQAGGGGGGGSTYALEKFDELLEKAEIGPEIFDKLGQGLNNLSNSAEKLTDVASASVASQEFVSKINSATESFNDIVEANKKTSSSINESGSQLSESYSNTANLINQSGNEFASAISKSGQEVTETLANSSKDIVAAYQQILQSVNQNQTSITESNKSYSEQLESLNKNLSALNAVYELQLQNTNEHMKNSDDVFGNFNQMAGQMKEALEASKQFKDEVSKLGQNLSQLNSVYGNMLSAMNINTNTAS